MNDFFEQTVKRILALEMQITQLQEEVLTLKQKQVKTSKRTSDSFAKLQAAKKEFIDSKPELRTDDFTDTELVFWISFLLSKTKYREKLDTWAEVGKRAKRVKSVVAWFDEHGNGRTKTRLYFQVIIGYIDKIMQSFEHGNVFYIITSDWALNQWGNDINERLQTLKFEDKPYEGD
jgi:hypothetical protein